MVFDKSRAFADRGFSLGIFFAEGGQATRRLSIFVNDSGDADETSNFHRIALVLYARDDSVGESIKLHKRLWDDRDLGNIHIHDEISIWLGSLTLISILSTLI